MVDFNKIQNKWQKKWEEKKIFKVKEDPKMPKYYCLEMFPYPSGSGLHMGHAFNYTIGDIYSRFKRMNGFNVLYPMGYDSFGLPAENAAIQAKIHPKKFTDNTIKNFIKQQKSLGLSYDWDRMVSTCTPEYYKWNQYFFLKFLEKGLVYRKNAPVNWCPKCNTVLANEQVHDGKCWRHTDTEVDQKYLEQWFIKTTEYADELLEAIPKLDWPERIKMMQENWIGRSDGLLYKAKVKDMDLEIGSFNTHFEACYADTFVVIAPDHPLLPKLIKGISNEKKVLDFSKKIVNERLSKNYDETEVEGIFTGRYVMDPLGNGELPIWVSNYALADYGTGMVKCSAHDERDFKFAKKYNIPLKVVLVPEDIKQRKEVEDFNVCFTDMKNGLLLEPKEFKGKRAGDCRNLIVNHCTQKGFAKSIVMYKLKDWLVSRQRYWGTPIPIVHCSKCGLVPVPEKDLPILLPEKVKFGKGNPLATNKEFVDVKCPKCKGKAKRETDTMDTFFDSSWYFLRYCDPQNGNVAFDKKKAKYWMPVDQYIGGAEHACMHLIYARFFTKALRDMNMLHFDEPFTKLFNQGMLHGEDGHVMSKSRGNVVLPEEISEKYGIDTARFFLVSIASPDKDLEWSSKGIEGSARFVNRLWNYFNTVKIKKSSPKVESKLNKAIKGIIDDIENFKYNFAVIKIRELFEALEKEVSKETLEKFLKLLHPFCPHITEELWEKIKNKPFISLETWPKVDESKIDEKAEELEKITENVIGDVRAVLKLLKIDKPKEIILFVADKWKYKFFSNFKKEVEKTRNIGELIKKTIIKEYAKDISALVPRLVKDATKVPEVVLDQETELKTLKDSLEIIKQEFGTDEVAVFTSEDSKEAKANQAMPGKPAILIQ